MFPGLLCKAAALELHHITFTTILETTTHIILSCSGDVNVFLSLIE